LLSGSTLLPSLPPRAGSYALRWLQQRGATVKFNSHQSVADIRSQRTAADFVFDCTGLQVVPLPVIVASSSVGPHFSVNVHQQLLSEGGRIHPRVFAIGDCCAPPLPCPKLAYTAELQAAVAADNVAALMRGESSTLSAFPLSLSSVLPAPFLVCCSLGPWDGVIVFNEVTITGWLAAVMKWVIEVSKVRQYRGSWAAEVLWNIAEPSTFLLNRAYQAIKAAGQRWTTRSLTRREEVVVARE